MSHEEGNTLLSDRRQVKKKNQLGQSFSPNPSFPLPLLKQYPSFIQILLQTPKMGQFHGFHMNISP